MKRLLLLTVISIGMRYLGKASSKAPSSPLDWRAVTVETIAPAASLQEITAALGDPVDPKKVSPWNLVHWSRSRGTTRVWGHHLEHKGHPVARTDGYTLGFVANSGPSGWQCSHADLLWMLGPATSQSYLPELQDPGSFIPSPYRIRWGQPGRSFQAVLRSDQSWRAVDFGLEWPERGPDQGLAFRSPYSASDPRRDARR